VLSNLDGYLQAALIARRRDEQTSTKNSGGKRFVISTALRVEASYPNGGAGKTSQGDGKRVGMGKKSRRG
jgi:hypothetical protein